MTRTFLVKHILTFLLSLSVLFVLPGCLEKINHAAGKETDEYDSPDQAMKFEFDRTIDPATGTVPRDRLIRAMQYTDSLKAVLPFQLIAGYGNWTERGPNSDAVGPSNGNTRANSGITSGRIRAILVDAADATGNTVWVGGVAGGLWKTTDITASSPTWTFVDDFFSNMAITGICQDPTTPATMYFCTGEAFFNSDAVAGNGVWKSTNSGVTWTQLTSTIGANFDNCSKILCDAAHNIYVATRSGLFRSTDGGTSWSANIRPSSFASSRISDIELSSTGRLHISSGIFSTCEYRYTDIPATVSAGAGWSTATGYPSSSVRIELGCNGSILYALPSDASFQVPAIYKSTDGGANWAATSGVPPAGWASQQAWYALAVDIDGSGDVIIGGLDPYKSTDGGANWTKLADWTNNVGLPPTTTEYVHADIHFIKMYGANRVLFGCDGGIFYSSNSGSTIRDRNSGLRIKQFYSCAIHPSTTNYFLAGAQDNGSHQFSSAGLGSTVEVTGGDGAFVHIDQDEPQYQFTSYVRNQYRRSTNSGGAWSNVNFSSTLGQFINPTDYDDASNIMYCGYSGGFYKRWTDPQTGGTNANINITGFNGSSVTAITVSPYSSNRVYFGTTNDVGATSLCYVINANTVASGSAGTSISTGLPTNVTTSCIAVGTDDNHLMVCYSNYGVQQVWVSSNNGTNWTNIDGDLPDMPVRWCMFVPGSNNTQAFLATEAGVYLTLAINTAGTTNWIPSPTFPLVRTDMLQYRTSDGIVAAATHGRGLWTQPYFTIVPANNFLLKGRWQNNTTVELAWEYDGPNTTTSMEIEESTDALHFYKVGSVLYNGKSYSFVRVPAQKNVYYRIKSKEAAGNDRYSNSIRLFKNSTGNELTLQNIFPNPVQNDINIAFSVSAKGSVTYLVTNLAGQVVMKKEEYLQYIGAYKKSWSLRGLVAGAYDLTIVSNGERRSQRFVKQ